MPYAVPRHLPVHPIRRMRVDSLPEMNRASHLLFLLSLPQQEAMAAASAQLSYEEEETSIHS